MKITAFLLTTGLAYLIGSVSPSYLVGELIKGVDLREHGSGNLGFSNALRVLGKGPGIAVLLFDVLKGFFAVWIAKGIGLYLGLSGEFIVVLNVMAGLAVILGHIYTCFLGFKGGKGVATGLGVFLYLSPAAVTLAFVVWVITVFITRYISLGSILAAISLPVFIWSCNVFVSACSTNWTLFLAIVIAAMVVLKHISNIQRLLAGCENKFSWNKND